VQPIKISDKLSVAAQPALEDIPAIAQAGFTMILNNRPDGEDAVQPSSAAEAAAASEAGLRYRDIPVAGPTITEEKVRSFQAGWPRQTARSWRTASPARAPSPSGSWAR